jgi:outer membrane protein assembly factor BamB
MPAEAEIWQGGKPLRLGLDGDTAQRTPAVVFCYPTGGQRFELRKAGFRPLEIDLDPHASATSHHVMTVIPDAEFEFEAPVQTGAGAGSGFVVAGLRGGRIGVARIGGGGTTVLELGGLREVAGTPVVVLDRVIVRTNDNHLCCYQLPNGTELFSVRLESEPVHDPVVRDGRVVLADIRGGVHCYEASRGTHLWSVAVPGGEIAGAPCVEGRRVRVGTRSGVYQIVDATSGEVIRSYASLPGLSSAIAAADGRGYFATQEGFVAAVDESTGRLLWRTEIGPSPAEGTPCLLGDSLYVANGTGQLLELKTANGTIGASLALPGKLRFGPAFGARKLFVTVLEQPDETKQNDLVLALEPANLEVSWEFRDGGTFRGPVTADANAAYLSGSTGKVLRFQ